MFSMRSEKRYAHNWRPAASGAASLKFCGTLTTVPLRSSTKQWKIVLSADGAQ